MEIRISHGSRVQPRFGIAVAVAAFAGATILVCHGPGNAQPSSQQSAAPTDKSGTGSGPAGQSTPGQHSGELLQVPVTGLLPGNVEVRPNITNPVGDNTSALEQGMHYFNSFNCVGCHAPNGSGGMGPSLSDTFFIYGSAPENIYLSILQGRPNGMPAWGSMLPDQVIWSLVSYIQSLSKGPPSKQWGTTISPTQPDIEQVPAEFQETPRPWDHTQKFGKGQKPQEP